MGRPQGRFVIASQIARFVKTGWYRAGSLAAVTTSLRHLLPALAVLSGDRRRDLPLATVGRLVALSPHHAQRTFRRIVGESPKRYQLRLRLEEAAAVLVASDRAIAEVAFDSGFNSHETFSRAFRRHFGHTPSAYRQRALSCETPTRQVSRMAGASLIERTGPCVGLYRSPISIDHVPGRKRSIMSYEIEVRDLDETPFIFMRRRIELNDVAGQLAEMLPAVFGHVMEVGLAMAGPPVVRHVEQSPAFVTLEAGIPLAEAPEPPEAETGIEVGALTGGKAAVTIHTGPYEGLTEAYAAIDRWLAAEGKAPSGAPWEVYLTDPGEVPDPADWKTQIIWPLAD